MGDDNFRYDESGDTVLTHQSRFNLLPHGTPADATLALGDAIDLFGDDASGAFRVDLLDLSPQTETSGGDNTPELPAAPDDPIESTLDREIGEALRLLTPEPVLRAWVRALRRRSEDPDGAITAARTLLETTCKCLLDAAGAKYESKDDLPRLLKLAMECMQLAPSAQSNAALRQLLSGCVSVVTGISALRNELGDAHGHGPADAHAEPRHAALLVNVASAVTVFLADSFHTRGKGDGSE
jgi:hypothetical protein